MCQASVQAFQDLWQFGTITSGAVMVPCPWFPAVAQMCREHPDMDMGSMPRSTRNGTPIAGGRCRLLTRSPACSTIRDTSITGSRMYINMLNRRLWPQS